MIINARKDFLGMWALLSGGGYPYEQQYDSSFKIDVKCPSGKVFTCCLDYSSEKSVFSQILFEEVEKQTGVPMKLQMLSFRKNLIHPGVPLSKYNLKDGCCINLLIKGVGGGGETDTGIYII